jgi:TPR repeat protein
MFAHGMGVEENITIALRWLRKAAEQDNNIALRELGFLYDEGKGVAQSRDEATRLISKAASLGDQKAIDWIDKNFPDKPQWLKTLCLSND